jgi:aerobic-type carbon monoxide dehydrogenase small subunit (CoxS/CutS family)
LTVEGLAANGDLRPLQEAFQICGLQCGYCTPSMLISAYYLLKQRANPTGKKSVWPFLETSAAAPVRQYCESRSDGGEK